MVCAIGFAVFGIVLILNDPMSWQNPYSGLLTIVGLMFFLLFTTAAIAIFLQMIRRGPAIIIGEYGIWDARVSNGFIPWSEIKDIHVHMFSRQKFIGIDVDHPELYVVGHGIRSVKRNLNQRAGFSPIQITLTALKANPDTVIDSVREYHSRFRSIGLQAAE